MSNDINNLARRRREEQLFFVNGTQISGIQSLDANYSTNYAPLKFIGMNETQYIQRGPKTASITLNQSLIASDQFLKFTGSSGFNGYVFKSKSNTSDNFSFTSGYLTSYNSRCGIGNIPEVSIGVQVYGNIGELANTESLSHTRKL